MHGIGAADVSLSIFRSIIHLEHILHGIILEGPIVPLAIKGLVDPGDLRSVELSYTWQRYRA